MKLKNLVLFIFSAWDTLVLTDATDKTLWKNGGTEVPEFKPLRCNDQVEWNLKCSPTEALALSELVSASASDSSIVSIPCGECAVVDYTDGETIEIPGGIDVVGRLHFPVTASVTIRTTHVVVQGIFSSDPPISVPFSTASNKVEIFLYEETGVDNTYFVPHEDNLEVGNLIGIGRKAFAVAGGLMDVHAVDSSFPAWEHLLDYVVEKVPVTDFDLTGPTPGPKPQPPLKCSRVLYDVDFKVGDEHLARNTGGWLYIKPHNETNGEVGDDAFLEHSRRTTGHGFILTVPDAACIAPDEPYLLSGRARLRGKGVGAIPACTREGGSNFCIGVRIENREGDPLYGSQTGQWSHIEPDEWFEFSFPVKALSPALIGNTTLDPTLELHFNSFHNSQIVDLDWLRIELPSKGLSPDDTPEDCTNLVFGGGDAESYVEPNSGDSTWPWTTKAKSNYLFFANETRDDGSINHFYRHHRNTAFDGITYKTGVFATPCVVAGEEYRLNAKVRAHSSYGMHVPFWFGYKQANGDWKSVELFDLVGRRCPKSSNTLGWVDCELRITATTEIAASLEYKLWTLMTLRNAPYPTIDYDDISFSRFYPQSELHKIHVSKDAATYWGEGSELLLTSSTYSQDDAYQRMVVDTDPAAGTITIDREIPFTTSAADDARFPVEVASLSRNFVITAEDAPDDDLHGGHVIILMTPDVQQQIEGIAFENLGQQGNIGRYPIHFHMCNAAEGALVSKNVILHSNQRGVVLHGTHNVTVSDNVIFNIKGHGYLLEDGAEQFNRFYRNLATGMYPLERVGLGGTDVNPSGFWMTNTMNYWDGNVAAGSAFIGFWIEPGLGRVRGLCASLPQYKWIRRTRLPLLHFKNNDVHSCTQFGMRMYPSRYIPTQEAQLVNFRVYHNPRVGLNLHINNKIRLEGGYYGDNGGAQIWNTNADDVYIEGVEIVGLSQEFREALQRGNKSPVCDKWPMFGLTFSMVCQFGGSEIGMTLKDTLFRNFDCGGRSIALHIGDKMNRNYNDVYDAVTKFDNINFDNVPVRLSACLVEDQGIDSVAIEDVNGDLNPYGRSHSTPGFLVSRNSPSSPIIGADCMETNGCMMYCENICLQTIVVYVFFVPTYIEMVVTDASGTEFIIPSRPLGSLFNVGAEGIDTSKWSIWRKDCSIFGVSIPAGTFGISFRMTNGDRSTIYPWAIPQFDAPPTCEKDQTIINFNQTMAPSFIPTTSPPSFIPTTSPPSFIPTTSPPPTMSPISGECEGLGKRECKRLKINGSKICTYGAKKLKTKICIAKKKMFSDDCSGIMDENQCKEKMNTKGGNICKFTKPKNPCFDICHRKNACPLNMLYPLLTNDRKF